MIIDLSCSSEGYNIIGTSTDEPFTGTFDGNGFTLSNFSPQAVGEFPVEPANMALLVIDMQNFFLDWFDKRSSRDKELKAYQRDLQSDLSEYRYLHTLQTAYYAEYNSTGSGANSQSRVNWSHQLSRQKHFTFAGPPEFWYGPGVRGR